MTRNHLGQFVKGTHWRKPQIFRDKSWLEREYVERGRSTPEIAEQFGVTDAAIVYWLRQHGITRRNTAQARAKKHWGAVGEANPMFGRTGRLNPRWNGGHSPERQTMYARAAWKEVAKTVLRRDNYRCAHCSATSSRDNRLEVHHIKPWSKYPECRFELSNLITLCSKCHKNEHRKKV